MRSVKPARKEKKRKAKTFLAFLHSLSALLMFHQRQGKVAVPENQRGVSFICTKVEGLEFVRPRPKAKASQQSRDLCAYKRGTPLVRGLSTPCRGLNIRNKDNVSKKAKKGLPFRGFSL